MPLEVDFVRMHGFSRISSAFLLVSLLLLLPAVTSAVTLTPDPVPVPKNVLVLHAQDQFQPANLVDFTDLSQDAAQKAVQVLEGASASDTPTAVIANRDIFDWNQMVRWGISARDLPAGSTVFGKPTDIWTRYRWEIVGAAVFVVTEALLIFLLFLQLRLRRKAERKLIRANERIRSILEATDTGPWSRLVQQQKLESIGTLASGVAHEINNPIFGIINYAQIVLEDLGTESTDATYLQGIVDEGRRISDIVRNLLQFSRQDQQSTTFARIEDIVERSLSLMKVVLRRDGIAVLTEFEPGLPDLACRSQQIQQVVMNLLSNARDSLNARFAGADPEKHLHIRASRFREDGRSWIRLSVEDHGTGIPSDVLPKIFEPFYSTKPKESGTGLGLSISYGIVQNHGGRIEVTSEPGSGTTFRVLLPVEVVQTPLD